MSSYWAHWLQEKAARQWFFLKALYLKALRWVESLPARSALVFTLRESCITYSPESTSNNTQIMCAVADGKAQRDKHSSVREGSSSWQQLEIRYRTQDTVVSLLLPTGLLLIQPHSVSHNGHKLTLLLRGWWWLEATRSALSSVFLWRKSHYPSSSCSVIWALFEDWH